ncbi:MAG: enoyl-ACP reductase [Alphaproteobacteria bacterium]|nr:enoyl-ACP reductase [Alphaproteobacteria bacterium]
MDGKVGIVTGVANDRSIAWGIAKALHREGARITLSYQSSRLLKRIELLAAKINADFIEVDATDPEGMVRLATKAGHLGGIDFFVHAMAYADREALNGRFIDTKPEAFSEAMRISCYSLIEMVQVLESHLKPEASVLTLSFEGARRTFQNYNLMGAAKAALEASVRYLAVDLGNKNVRINALSAGAMRTVAGSAIGSARFTYQWLEKNTPLGRNPLLDEVGNSGLYLLSALSRGVTGEVHHADCGYNTVGMVCPKHDAPA